MRVILCLVFLLLVFLCLSLSAGTNLAKIRTNFHGRVSRDIKMTDSETLFYKADRKSESEWSLQINGRVFGTVKKAVVFNHRGQPVENMCNTYLESTHHSQMYHHKDFIETVYTTNNIAIVKNSTVTVTNYSIWGRTITWFFWGDNHLTFSEDFFKTKAIAATFKHIWFSDEYMITIEAGADIEDQFANFVMFSALEYA